MKPSGPTSWLLDGRTGWRTATAVGVSAGRSGLQLTATTTGPLHLASPDGSLGGLTLPRDVAFDAEYTLHLLVRADLSLRRYDPATKSFVALPGVGGQGSRGRQFSDPGNIAIGGGLLYVADTGNGRVQAFGLRTLVLRHVWTGADVPSPPTGSDPWEPVDVATHGGMVYVLDGRHGRVFRPRPGTSRWQTVVGPGADTVTGRNAPQDIGHRWSRIALDREGRIYLLDAVAGSLAVFDPGGRRLADVTDATAVRDRFGSPPVMLDHAGRFCLPESLSRECGRRPPHPPPSLTAPLALCQPCTEERLVFDRSGERTTIDPNQAPGPVPYLTEGIWFSQPLDSGIARCRWHRIEVDLGDLPVGTRIEVATFSSETALSNAEIARRPAEWWDTGGVFFGSSRPLPVDGASTRRPEDFLIQTRSGQYLWLKVTLRGDGSATPAVRRLRVHYPRESYLRYLPAVFAEDEESRGFLERFLAIFQTEWDELERTIAETAAYIDPAAVPSGPFLDSLASWLALPLEGDWDGEQRRRLLAKAPQLYPRRGTIDGLRDFIRVYLENITGRPLDAFANLPMIVEGYRERHHLMVNDAGEIDLGAGASLWGPAVVGRLQLGVHARAGEARLIAAGDPERDLFGHYAHRFRIFIPAPWVPDARAERMVRRALDEEKPAHTRYDLCLIEPRFQLGPQSSIGLDTIIGEYPVARLACPERAAGADTAEDADPPSRRLRNRLGYDTILAGSAETETLLRLDPGIRLGLETTIG